MKFLVIGDALLDHYTYAYNTRFSPEDNTVRIWDVVERKKVPGGCLNVAANLASLVGFPVHLSAIVQHVDRAWLKREYKVWEAEDLCITTHEPLRKERVVDVATGEQVIRMDTRTSFTSGSTEGFWMQLERNAGLLDAFDCIVVSDYCKGTISEPVIKALRGVHCPVFVDTKRVDLSWWADLPECFVKINAREFAHSKFSSSVNVVVTHGAHGAVYYPRDDKDPIHVPAQPVLNADCVGAGDTYLAGLVDAYVAQQQPIDVAMRHADLVARASVRKPGTAIVSPFDIEQELWHDYGCERACNNL